MRSRPVYLLHISLAVLLLSAAAPAHAVPIMINNGSAPPNPENVIDGADDYGGFDVYVRNAGCPPGWPIVSPADPCASPGAATEVEVVSGGMDYLVAFDSSSITMSDGSASHLNALDSSTVTMSGGSLERDFNAVHSSTVTMSGGTVVDGLTA